MSVSSLKKNIEADDEVEQTDGNSDLFYYLVGVISFVIPIVCYIVLGFALVASLSYEGEEKRKWKLVLKGWLVTFFITCFLGLCVVLFALLLI